MAKNIFPGYFALSSALRLTTTLSGFANKPISIDTLAKLLNKELEVIAT
jgi:hypothetical protein